MFLTKAGAPGPRAALRETRFVRASVTFVIIFAYTYDMLNNNRYQEDNAKDSLYVQTDLFVRICKVLDCAIADVMAIDREEREGN